MADEQQPAQPAQGGYGYPPPALPGQGGYGFPPAGYPGSATPPPGGYQQLPVPYVPQQGPYQGRYGPSTFQGDADFPDWQAMAEQAEAAGRRKKRLMMAGVGVLAVVVVGAIVAASVLLTTKKPVTPVASGSPGPGKSGASAKPTTPEEALSSSATDKAKLSVDALFPDQKLTIGDQTFNRVIDDHTTDCTTVTNNGLGGLLGDCNEIWRATYLSDKTAVTVGVVVFDTKAQADKLKGQVKGNIGALRQASGPRFCPDLTKCVFTDAEFGRYAVFSTAGNADPNRPDTDPGVQPSGAALAKKALDTLTARGAAVVASAAG